MNDDKLGRLTSELLGGAVPDCLPDELDDVVGHIGSLLAAPGGPSLEQVRNATTALIEARLLTPARELTLHWSNRRGFDATIEKQLVQTLIELGDLDEAELRLADAVEQARALNTPQAIKELSEYQGQRGRIAKQRFV